MSDLAFHGATPERWADVEKLFGQHGACGGCWCMWFRQTRSQFAKEAGEPNRVALQSLVESGTVPGLLAYDGAAPVGWVAVEPRESFPALARSRILKRVDDLPVWSVVCFFVARSFRGKGLMTALLKAAVDHARQHGVTVVEGYPVEPKKDRIPDIYAYTGTVSAFRQAGFVEVARRSESRPIMRYVVGGQR